MADGAHRGDVRVEHARLAEAPRRSQPDRHAVARGTLQAVELCTTVDQTAGVNWPLIAERIHRTSVYGIPVQDGESISPVWMLDRTFAALDSTGRSLRCIRPRQRVDDSQRLRDQADWMGRRVVIDLICAIAQIIDAIAILR